MPDGMRPTMGGPDVEEYTRQRERERDAERANVAVAAQAGLQSTSADTRLEHLKQILRRRRVHTR